MIYLFDGSLEGLLCAVFEWFERKPGPTLLEIEAQHQPDAFEQVFKVENHQSKADRVWKGLQKKLDKGWMRRFYCAYLSELPEAYTVLFKFCCYIFSEEEPPHGLLKNKSSEKTSLTENYGNPHVLFVSQMAGKVEREKHRMEAFIRFQHTADGIFYCGIDPDYNVMPLIMKHFKDRYADQRWIIYDLKRDYGLYYNLEKVEQVHMDLKTRINFKSMPDHAKSERETLYAQLWKDYFNSTNIPARKNTKLHVQHVPKRYWKYLTEKQLSLQ